MEELDKTLAHFKQAKFPAGDDKKTKSLVDFYLDKNPEYIKDFKKFSSEPVVSGENPSKYMEGFGFSDYVDMELEL